MKYWILKSEASCYSIDDLKKDKKTAWSGVRNYQARNFMRDDMKKGDLALFYHSSTDPAACVGIAEIVLDAYPDKTQFDPKDEHFDSKSKKENPLWVNVNVAFKMKFSRPVTLTEIKHKPDLSGIMLTQKGSRLSVMPLSKHHFEIIKKLGS